MNFFLGTDPSKADHNGIYVDLPTLLETRMLVQANSGAGKSHSLRRILEQTHGHVQQLIIDLEGEFSTLREHFDYIYVAKVGGDLIPDPKTAGKLAERLLEFNASAILDLYEMKQHERITFVSKFLNSLMNVRKDLWHPCLIIIDECHHFAPERGESESLAAVIDLCTRGRKRSFCPIVATQRLSKLHKDVAAECLNVAIGRTSLDIDVKRAGDQMGFSSTDRVSRLRNLKPGEFFCYGPAIAQEVTLTQVGTVLTTHRSTGAKHAPLPPVPPTPKIIKILSQLTDLPKQAAEEARTIDELQKQVKSLKVDLKKATADAPAPVVDTKRTTELEDRVRRLSESNAQFLRDIKNRIERSKDILRFSRGVSATLEGLVKDFKLIEERSLPNIADPDSKVAALLPVLGKPVTPVPSAPTMRKPFVARPAPRNDSAPTIGSGKMRMLKAAKALHPKPISRFLLAFLGNMKPTSGTFSNYISELTQGGLLEKVGDGSFRITDQGLEEAGDVSNVPTDPEEVIVWWEQQFHAGAARILRYLFDAGGQTISRADVAAAVEMTMSGTFSNYISMLKCSGLIKVSREGLAIVDELRTA
jgi:hypothetical protein